LYGRVEGCSADFPENPPGKTSLEKWPLQASGPQVITSK